MDPAIRALHRAREEVVHSPEWENLNRELLSQIQRLERLEGGDPSAAFSNREKLAAQVGKATMALEKTRVYDELQLKVSKSLDRHFSPVESQPAVGLFGLSAENVKSTREKDAPTRNISEACRHLLLEWPHLECHLRNCLNHPLPPNLRTVAWEVILRHPSVRKEFLDSAAAKGFQEVNVTAEEKRIAHRCEILLNSNPVFHEMAASAPTVRAMKSIILFWSQKAGTQKMITDTDLLVCIPFLYVWREELSSWREELSSWSGAESGMGRAQNWTVVAKMAEQYVSFMEMLPLTMHSVILDHTLEAMNHTSLQVEQLLSSEDKKLYQALKKVLHNSASRVRFAVSQEEQLPFHKRLRSILQPHVQKMLVGDLSMEVLCYIWDQCFIGLNCGPDYQCLPYFITAWLILLREKLMACHSIESIEVILSTNSSSLTIPQFQKEIEKRFLQKLSSQLGITPVKLKERSKVHHWSSKSVASPTISPTRGGELKPVASPTISPTRGGGLKPVASSTISPTRGGELKPVASPTISPIGGGELKPVASPTISPTGGGELKPVVSPTMRLTQGGGVEPVLSVTVRPMQGSGRELEAATGEVTSATQFPEDPEKEELKRKISELQMKLEKQQTALSKEREEHQREMDTMMEDIEALKQKASQTIDKSQSQASSNSEGVSTVPTNITVLSPLSGSTGYSYTLTLPPARVLSTTSLPPAQVQTKDASSRPFSSSHLTESDVHDIWLKIFSRFTDAVHLVCHGTGSERPETA